MIERASRSRTIANRASQLARLKHQTSSDPETQTPSDDAGGSGDRKSGRPRVRFADEPADDVEEESKKEKVDRTASKKQEEEEEEDDEDLGKQTTSVQEDDDATGTTVTTETSASSRGSRPKRREGALARRVRRSSLDAAVMMRRMAHMLGPGWEDGDGEGDAATSGENVSGEVVGEYDEDGERVDKAEHEVVHRVGSGANMNNLLAPPSGLDRSRSEQQEGSGMEMLSILCPCFVRQRSELRALEERERHFALDAAAARLATEWPDRAPPLAPFSKRWTSDPPLERIFHRQFFIPKSMWLIRTALGVAALLGLAYVVIEILQQSSVDILATRAALVLLALAVLYLSFTHWFVEHYDGVLFFGMLAAGMTVTMLVDTSGVFGHTLLQLGIFLIIRLQFPAQLLLSLINLVFFIIWSASAPLVSDRSGRSDSFAVFVLFVLFVVLYAASGAAALHVAMRADFYQQLRLRAQRSAMERLLRNTMPAHVSRRLELAAAKAAARERRVMAELMQQQQQQQQDEQEEQNQRRLTTTAATTTTDSGEGLGAVRTGNRSDESMGGMGRSRRSSGGATKFGSMHRGPRASLQAMRSMRQLRANDSSGGELGWGGRFWQHEPSVTILFCDVTDFDRIVAARKPSMVVELLDGLWTLFDALVAKHAAHKQETVGNSYVAVAGLRGRRQDHAAAMALLGLDMLRQLGRLRTREGAPVLGVKIGVHTGPIVSGVVGLKKPQFCLFGDTMNTASRMKSSGIVGCVHASPECAAQLEDHFELRYREVDVKSKGILRTAIVLRARKRLSRRQRRRLAHKKDQASASGAIVPHHQNANQQQPPTKPSASETISPLKSNGSNRHPSPLVDGMTRSLDKTKSPRDGTDDEDDDLEEELEEVKELEKEAATWATPTGQLQGHELAMTRRAADREEARVKRAVRNLRRRAQEDRERRVALRPFPWYNFADLSVESAYRRQRAPSLIAWAAAAAFIFACFHLFRLLHFLVDVGTAVARSGENVGNAEILRVSATRAAAIGTCVVLLGVLLTARKAALELARAPLLFEAVAALLILLSATASAMASEQPVNAGLDVVFLSAVAASAGLFSTMTATVVMLGASVCALVTASIPAPWYPETEQANLWADTGFFVLSGVITGMVTSASREYYDRRRFANAVLLREETARAHALLYQQLPPVVVAQLSEGRAAVSDAFPGVTLLFCDIVGSTKLAARVAPHQVVHFIHKLFRELDVLTDTYGAVKVQTIGDAYVIACGLPFSDMSIAAAEAAAGAASGGVAAAAVAERLQSGSSRNGGSSTGATIRRRQPQKASSNTAATTKKPSSSTTQSNPSKSEKPDEAIPTRALSGKDDDDEEDVQEENKGGKTLVGVASGSWAPMGSMTEGAEDMFGDPGERIFGPMLARFLARVGAPGWVRVLAGEAVPGGWMSQVRRAVRAAGGDMEGEAVEEPRLDDEHGLAMVKEEADEQAAIEGGALDEEDVHSVHSDEVDGMHDRGDDQDVIQGMSAPVPKGWNWAQEVRQDEIRRRKMRMMDTGNNDDNLLEEPVVLSAAWAVEDMEGGVNSQVSFGGGGVTAQNAFPPSAHRMSSTNSNTTPSLSRRATEAQQRAEEDGISNRLFGGRPLNDVRRDAATMLRIAFAMHRALQRVPHPATGRPVQMRIGLHTGQLIGGVIGTKTLRYDIWGNDVLCANKMESSGVADEVCISDATKVALEHIPTLHFLPHVDVDVKGKGNVSTFLVRADQEFLLSDPHFK